MEVSGTTERNHPLALRMGIIAGVSHNIMVGTVFGTMSVLLAANQQRLTISPEQAAFGSTLLVVGSSVFASVVGVLAARFSLRLLMFVGAAMATAAFVILGLSDSYPLYLFAYGLLLGPSLALAASVGPASLVTRWFVTNRGLALGLVHLAVGFTLMPVLSNAVLEGYGISTTYLLLAAIVGLVLLPATLLIVDHPPGATPAAQETAAAPTETGGFTVAQLLRNGQFWAIAMAGTAVVTGAVTISTHLVPMALSEGFSSGQGALLLTVMAMFGMVGSIFYGWVVDKIGGTRALAVAAFASMILWAMMLLDLSYGWTVVVVGLLGLNGASMIPAMSRALAEAFGPESFSRAFGIATTVSLPFTILGVQGAAAAFGRTGSYDPAYIALAVYFALALVLAFMVRARPAAAAGISPA